MQEQLQKRLEELKKEFEMGQARLRELGAEQARISETMLRISGAILKWLLREPGVVGLLHVRRKTLGIKARELFVAGVLRGEELHEHRGVDDQRLAALHVEQCRLPFQRIVFVELSDFSALFRSAVSGAPRDSS